MNLSKKTYTSLAFAVLAAAGLITESLAATDTVEQVNARIKPIGQVRINDGSAPTPAAPAGSKTVGRSASEIYKKTCMACHAAGIANAPKIGDQPAWDARMAKGMDTLLGSVNKGMGAMPPKGGDATLTDDEIKATIKFMSEGAKESAVAATPTQTAVVEEKPAPKKKEPAPEKPVGQKIYESTCMACHLMGVAGAPKVGDHAAWAQRATKGIDGLTASVINGLNAMPPRAGNPQLTDVDIQQAVAYMLDKSK